MEKYIIYMDENNNKYVNYKMKKIVNENLGYIIGKVYQLWILKMIYCYYYLSKDGLIFTIVFDKNPYIYT